MHLKSLVVLFAALVVGVALGFWLSLCVMQEELHMLAREVVSERVDSFDESMAAGSRLIYRAQALSEKADMLRYPPGAVECEVWQRAKTEYEALREAKKYFVANDREALAGTPEIMTNGALSAFEQIGNGRDTLCSGSGTEQRGPPETIHPRGGASNKDGSVGR